MQEQMVNESSAETAHFKFISDFQCFISGFRSFISDFSRVISDFPLFISDSHKNTSIIFFTSYATVFKTKEENLHAKNSHYRWSTHSFREIRRQFEHPFSER